MRQWLWKDVVDCVGHFQAPLWYAPLSVLTIFVICSLIDILRQKTIETPMIEITEKLLLKIYARRKS